MTAVPPVGRLLAASVAAALLAGCVRVRVGEGDTVPVTADGARVAAQALLAHGAAAWNAGDLGGFMDDYAPDATFVTARGLVRGRDAIRARYAPYFLPGAVRDSLWFRDVEAWPVGPDAVQALAWWNLGRGDSLVASGPTSLLLRRTGGRWHIVHDHSS